MLDPGCVLGKLMSLIEDRAGCPLLEEGLEEGEYLDIDGCSGGNFDDAYAIGIGEGKTMFARILLAELDKLGSGVV